MVAGCAATGAAFLALGVFIADVAAGGGRSAASPSCDDPKRTAGATLLGGTGAPRGRSRRWSPLIVRCSQFADFENAPPMRPHLISADGRIACAVRQAADSGQPARTPLRGDRRGSADPLVPRRRPAGPSTNHRGRGCRSARSARPRCAVAAAFGARMSLSVAFAASLGALVVGIVIGGARQASPEAASKPC